MNYHPIIILFLLITLFQCNVTGQTIAIDSFFTKFKKLKYYGKDSIEFDLELKLANKLRQQEGASVYHNFIYFRNKGIFHGSFTNFEIAIVNLDSSLLFKPIPPVEEAYVYEKKGVYEYYLDNFDISLTHYLTALGMYEKQKGTALQRARIMFNIACIHALREEYSIALEYFKQVKIIVTPLNDRMEIKCRGNIAMMQYEMGEQEKSIKELEAMLSESLKKKFFQASTSKLDFLVDHYLKTDNALLTEKYLNLSIKLKLENGLDFLLLESYMDGIQLYKNTSTAHTSIYITKVEDFLKKSPSKKHQLELSKWSYEVEKRKGNTKKALAFLEKHNQLKADFFDTEKEKLTNELTKKYNLKIKKQEVQYLKKENELQRRITYVSSALLGLILAIILVIGKRILRNRANQLKLKDTQLSSYSKRITSTELQLANKREELQKFSIYLNQKNYVISSIQEALVESKNNYHHLKGKLEKIIKNNTNVDEDWETYQQYFTKVHPEFINKLRQKHPCITESDIRQCVYILSELSNKQIAQLVNINLSSVHVSHHRIKKKIGLGKEDNLMGYLKILVIDTVPL